MGKNIFKLHPLFIVTAFFCLFLGYFRFFITFTLIILFHECGHILMMLLFKWPIKKVILLPFGGLTICDTLINKSLKEDFLVAITGPIFQMIYAYFFKSPLVLSIHYPLLIFNLLPIYPMDGYKILNVFLNKTFPFYFTLSLTFFISILFLVFLPFIYFDFLFFLILLFLFFHNIKFFKNKSYLWHKFLEERIYYDFNFSKIKIISNIKRMYQGTYHFFKKDGIIIDEKNYLMRKW